MVESYWMLINTAEENREVVVLPDGRVDMFFSTTLNESFHTTIAGIETQPDRAILEPQTVIFAVSFKLLAIEHLFGKALSDMLDKVVRLPNGFKGFSEKDLSDFDSFCKRVDELLIHNFSGITLDNRKQHLFKLIYETKGSLSVSELSKNVHWSRRQINRYFNQYFGINLKAYCDILRFRNSFKQINEGRFFPEGDFADQSHFIKEIKKYSRKTPKALYKNENDRFIQFSLLT